MSFKEIEHTADRAFRVQGRNFAELLENAARAMSSLDPLGPSGEPSAVRTIEVEGIDREALLVPASVPGHSCVLSRCKRFPRQAGGCFPRPGQRSRGTSRGRQRRGRHRNDLQ
jgi:hypothetical protein